MDMNGDHLRLFVGGNIMLRLADPGGDVHARRDLYTGTNMRLYINGVLYAHADTSRHAPAKQPPFRIGADAGGGSLFAGRHRRAAVFDARLSRRRGQRAVLAGHQLPVACDRRPL